MNILFLHNRYQFRGGEDESTDLEIAMLRERGHTVRVIEADNRSLNFQHTWLAGAQAIWSQTSYKAVLNTLRTEHFDVIHVQNFFPLLSPSIFYAAQSAKVPIVLALRNYRLLCPNAFFFRKGTVCEDCLGKLIPWPSILHRCYRNSRVATVAVTAMLFTHRLMKTWQQTVNLFIAPTEFVRQKFIQGGFQPQRIVVKPNFVDPDPGLGSHNGDYALFVGRLSVEKGLQTLLAAWKEIGSVIPLKIIGDGPMSDKIADICRYDSYIEWLGPQSIDRVYAMMGSARVVIVPSQWYETFGRVIIEAYAKGTPVIASNAGAMSEIITHGHTGMLFRLGDPLDLASKVKWLYSHPDDWDQMSRNARAEFETRFTASKNYEILMKIYDMAINSRMHQ